MQEGFLPLCRADAEERGWHYVDCVVVTGDAYIDHPSFGAAIISRVLEAEGYRVGIISQPDFTTCESMREYGRPRLGFFIGGGNVDSMVAHYSVAKRRREHDEYTPGGVTGKRPDRCATVYTRLAKEAYPDVPVILGGLEASLRRFAHYDYWTDSVMASILEQSGADIVSYGMGEHQTREIARRLAAGEDVKSITDVAGTCYLTDFAGLPASYAECASLGRQNGVRPRLPHPDGQSGLRGGQDSRAEAERAVSGAESARDAADAPRTRRGVRAALYPPGASFVR